MSRGNPYLYYMNEEFRKCRGSDDEIYRKMVESDLKWRNFSDSEKAVYRQQWAARSGRGRVSAKCLQIVGRLSHENKPSKKVIRENFPKSKAQLYEMREANKRAIIDRMDYKFGSSPIKLLNEQFNVLTVYCDSNGESKVEISLLSFALTTGVTHAFGKTYELPSPACFVEMAKDIEAVHGSLTTLRVYTPMLNFNTCWEAVQEIVRARYRLCDDSLVEVFCVEDLGISLVTWMKKNGFPMKEDADQEWNKYCEASSMMCSDHCANKPDCTKLQCCSMQWSTYSVFKIFHALRMTFVDIPLPEDPFEKIVKN